MTCAVGASAMPNHSSPNARTRCRRQPPDQQQRQADAQPSQNKLARRDPAGEDPLVQNAELRGPEQRLDVQPVGGQYE